MGEYAKYGGKSVKIGTCENMYYLRFSQRSQVRPEEGSLDPADPSIVGELRFRFPWPDEDSIAPGAFDSAFKLVGVPGDWEVGAGVEHYSVQFTAREGYNVSLPCPEDPAAYAKDKCGALVGKAHGLRVHRNGIRGKAVLVAQKFRPGIGLVPILQCGACGAMYRIEDRSEIEALAVEFRSEGDRRREGPMGWHHTVADRILAGITESVTV